MRRIALASWLSMLAAGTLQAAVMLPAHFTDYAMINMLEAPAGMAFLPDGRLLLVEQYSGAVKLWTGPSQGIGALTILTVPDVRSGVERGLVGIAVDPRWPAEPYVYVHYDYYSYPDSDVRISRFTCAGDLTFTSHGALAIDPASRYDVLTGNRDRTPNHNGGTLRFDAAGLLYASFGDDLDGCSAQDSTNLNGKILRLDVSALPPGPGGPPPRALITPATNPFAASPDSNQRLVFAMGLRNPFRFHLDPATDDLWITDVGEDRHEEVDLLPSGSTGPRNFGWPWYEGNEPYGTCSSGATTGFAPPLFVYDHDIGVAAISAGLYRRNGGASQFPPEYDGDYFFADYGTGELCRLKNVAGRWQLAPPVEGQPSARAWGTGMNASTDWAIGPDGALWWTEQNLVVFRVHRITYDVVPVDTAATRADGLYDLQGRRSDGSRSGVYFRRTGKKRVVVK